MPVSPFPAHEHSSASERCHTVDRRVFGLLLPSQLTNTARLMRTVDMRVAKFSSLSHSLCYKLAG